MLERESYKDCLTDDLLRQNREDPYRTEEETTARGRRPGEGKDWSETEAAEGSTKASREGVAMDEETASTG